MVPPWWQIQKIRTEARNLLDGMGSDDRAEGAAAVAERRTPVFHGE